MQGFPTSTVHIECRLSTMNEVLSANLLSSMPEKVRRSNCRPVHNTKKLTNIIIVVVSGL